MTILMPMIILSFTLTIQQSSTTQELVSHLFKDYIPEAAPSFPVKVKFAIALLDLIEVDEKHETIKINEWRCYYWKDKRLSWNASLFDGIDAISIPHSNVWKPDIRLYNMVGREEVVQDLDRVQVRISQNGSVNHCEPEITTVRCPMDVSRLPFDIQSCTLHYESWSQSKKQLQLEQLSKIQLIYDSFESSEWHLVDSKIQIGSKKYFEGDGEQTYANVRITVSIGRHGSYYLWVIVVPSVILTTLNTIGVFTPFNAGGERQEKVTLGLTTLLAMILMVQIVTDSTPRSAHGLPLLARYILFEIFLTAFVIVLAVLLMFINHRALSHGWDVPKWLLCFVCLQRNKKRKNENNDEKAIHRHEGKISDEISIAFRGIHRSIDDLNDALIDSGSSFINNKIPHHRRIYGLSCQCRRREVVMAIEKLQYSVDRLATFVEDKEEYKREKTWNHVLDRVDFGMMVLFIFGNIVVTVFVFVFPQFH